ncbi:condensation domain-containing protein, partial [Streptomyces rhizosphaericus]
TPNGKLDRAALPAPTYTQNRTSRGPVTEREKILCRLFAEVLGLPEVGVDESFFDLGGDSIMSIQLVSAARRAGLKISPRDVFERKTVAEVALVATGTEAPVREKPGADVGAVPLTPIVQELAQRGGPFREFNQSTLVQVPPGLVRSDLVRALQAVLDHHAALRMRLTVDRPTEPGPSGHDGSDAWTLETGEPGAVPADACLHHVAAAGLDDDALGGLMTEHGIRARRRLSPEAGVMVQVVWFDRGLDVPGRLLLVVHHLVVDGVSLRILVPDLAQAWRDAVAGRPVELEPVGTSLRQWAHQLHTLAHEPETVAELAQWTEFLRHPDPALTDREIDPRRDTAGKTGHLVVTLPADMTAPLLTSVPAAFHAEINDVLLTGFALATSAWRGRRGRGGAGDSGTLLELEAHGRQEEAVPGADLSRTIGWFTSTYPLRLDPGRVTSEELASGGPAVGTALKHVKEQLRSVPGKGLGFGLLRYLNPKTGAVLAGLPHPRIKFNYLGRFTAGNESADWGTAPGAAGMGGGRDADMPVRHLIEVNAMTHDGERGPELTASWSWAAGLLDEHEVRELAEAWFQALRALVRHVEQGGADAGGFTPSDVSWAGLDQNDIDLLEAEWRTSE